MNLERMRELWENSPELTAVDIGERFGVSKNVVIGHARRGDWNPRGAAIGPEPTTLLQRLDAINAVMDRVLADARQKP